MFEALGRALSRRKVALLVVVVSLVGAALSVVESTSLQRDDDLLAFLPRAHPDVARFEEVNRRFGGLQVALVGLEGDDLFDRDVLEGLQRLTSALDDLPEVTRALSITNVEDMRPDPVLGGITIAPVVGELPQGPEAEAALRAHVLSRDHVVGTFVSDAGHALLIYCFSAQGSNPRVVAEAIRGRVLEEFPDRRIVWGGAPFVSSYIYDTTQADMDRLIPWSVAAILLVLLVTFRDLRGTLLALFATSMGIAVAHGAMAAAKVPFNLVLSSMPVILFAVGSAYSIHILSLYYRLEPLLGSEGAMRRTLIKIGPVVAASGGTTVAGLLSFLTMDIAPMRDFGLFTAVGILATLVLSLTFVPAVIFLSGLRRTVGTSGPGGFLPRAAGAIHGRRVQSLVVIAVLSIGAALFAGQVDSRMDHAAFFSPGSPPAEADAFLNDYFGGAQFVQVQVEASMKDPEVLRELRLLADRLRELPTVTDVLHVGDVIARANEVMEGVRRIPDTQAKTALLLGFLTGNKAIAQLVDEDRTEALLQIKSQAMGPDATEALLEGVEQRVAEQFAEPLARVSSEDSEGRDRLLSGIAARIRVLGLQANQQLPSEAEIVALLSRLGFVNSRTQGDAASGLGNGVEAVGLARELEVFLRSEECIAEIPAESEAPGLVSRIAEALVGLGPGPTEVELLAALVETTGRGEEDLLVMDLSFAVGTALDELWASARARSRAVALAGALTLSLDAENKGAARLREGLAAATTDLDLMQVLAPQTGSDDLVPLRAEVTGLPVLHRGMSDSVRKNQRNSLVSALLLVLVLLSLLFRSPLSGLLATLPTAITLLWVFGLMGLFEVHLDIGTSMLAGLIIGAGVDYGVHLVAAWRAGPGEGLLEAAQRAASDAGPAVWTNAIMVAVGFAVLTLGEARPLQNVGRLTALAMLGAAVATFVAIPALAGRRSYLGDSRAEATEHPAL